MAKGKTKDQAKDKQKMPSDRAVYREFGSDAAAFERPTPSVPDLPPQQQNIRIQASRKGRGGKTVTVIQGFQQSPDSLAQLLKKLKNQCGTGGTLKDETLEIQGDHTQKLLTLLVELGYKAKISGGK